MHKIYILSVIMTQHTGFGDHSETMGEIAFISNTDAIIEKERVEAIYEDLFQEYNSTEVLEVIKNLSSMNESDPERFAKLYPYLPYKTIINYFMGRIQGFRLNVEVKEMGIYPIGTML